MSIFSAVVLAAGGSSRLGESKQLIEYGGIPLVRRAALAALAAGAESVIVVLGADADRVGQAFGGLPNVRTVVNEDWKSGMASSLAAGLRSAAENPAIDAALILLADQPLVDAEALQEIVAAFGSERIVASSYSDTIGVPALLGREFFSELSELEGDRGAGGWLRQRMDVRVIPLSAATLDIDTPDDLARLKEE